MRKIHFGGNQGPMNQYIVQQKSDSDHDNSFSGSYKTRVYNMNSKDIKFFFENKRSRFCYQIKQPKSLVSEIDFLLYNIVQTVSLFGWYHEV